MAKILLLRPSNLISRNIVGQPLGLLYLTSYLRMKNPKHHIALIDMCLKKYTDEEILLEVEKFNPDVVGFSSMTGEFEVASRIASKIKKVKPGVVNVLGGAHASSDPDSAVECTHFDYAVIGEGEETFTELVEAVENKLDTSNIKGIYYKRNNCIIRTEDRLPIDDLDKMPFPAWDTLDFEKYFIVSNGYSALLADHRFMPIFTSRGCPYGCVYCHNNFGKKTRFRSAESVVDEIEILHRKYKIKDFMVSDDVFNLDRKRVEAICDLIVSRNLRIKLAFPSGLRGDLITPTILKKLKKAGTYSICYAIETASPRLQEVIQKHAKIDKLREVIEMTNKAGIFTIGFFMFGLPSETIDEVKKTIEFAAKTKLNVASFMVLKPFKGTKIYETLKSTKHMEKLSGSNVDYFAPTEGLGELSKDQLSIALYFANRRFLLSVARFWDSLKKIPRKRYIPMLILYWFFRLWQYRKLMNQALLKGKKEELNIFSKFLEAVPR